MGTRQPWIMAVWCGALIGCVVAVASCTQLKEVMQQQKETSLKNVVDQGQFKQFATIAGGGAQAVAEFHRINMLLLADREAAYGKFPGDEEGRRCRIFAGDYSFRAGGLLGSNLDDQALVMAFFDQMPANFDKVNNFRGCGITGNALEFRGIPVPNIERLLRTHPQYRTAQFRAAVTRYLDDLESLVARVQPDAGDWVTRGTQTARQDIARFIGN